MSLHARLESAVKGLEAIVRLAGAGAPSVAIVELAEMALHASAETPDAERMRTKREQAPDKFGRNGEQVANKTRICSRVGPSPLVLSSPPSPDNLSKPQEIGDMSTGRAGAKRGRPRLTKTYMPDDGAPDEEWIAFFAKWGFGAADRADSEWPKFVDHFRSNGKPMKSWRATWRQWRRRAPEFNGARRT